MRMVSTTARKSNYYEAQDCGGCAVPDPGGLVIHHRIARPFFFFHHPSARTTILVVVCYHFENRSTSISHDSETRQTGSRVAHRTPADGAAGFAGAPVDSAGPMGAAPRSAHVRRIAAAMRCDVAQRAEPAHKRAAPGAHHRAHAGRLPIDGARREPAGVDLPARPMGKEMGPYRMCADESGCSW